MQSIKLISSNSKMKNACLFFTFTNNRVGILHGPVWSLTMERFAKDN